MHFTWHLEKKACLLFITDTELLVVSWCKKS